MNVYDADIHTTLITQMCPDFFEIGNTLSGNGFSEGFCVGCGGWRFNFLFDDDDNYNAPSGVYPEIVLYPYPQRTVKSWLQRVRSRIAQVFRGKNS